MSITAIRNLSARLGPRLSQRTLVGASQRAMGTFEDREKGEEVGFLFVMVLS